MSLRRAFIGCRIIETSENYERADLPLIEKPPERPAQGHFEFLRSKILGTDYSSTRCLLG